MTIQISHAKPVEADGTIVTFEGIPVEATHQRITFGVDHRIAEDILFLDPTTVLDVEDWQVLAVRNETMHEHFMSPFYVSEDPVTRIARND